MDVDIKVCKSCKSIFHTMSNQTLCPDCRAELEALFKEIKEYVRDNDDVGVSEVSIKYNVSRKQILQWVREDRLYFKDENKVMVPCLSCGKMIRSGNLCRICQSNFDANASQRSKRNEEGMKMSNSTKPRYMEKGERR